MMFNEKYGPWAIITGASSGIGKEFANQLASKGLNLVLVARRNDKLLDLSEKLELKFKIQTKVIKLDLLGIGSVEKIILETKDLNVGMAILNAGMEVHGSFLFNNLEKETNVLKLNAIVPMQLAHHFGNKMIQRKKGGIIFVSSTFGHQAIPYFANYSASKSYILNLGQALNYELKKSGIDVVVLSPGLTNTEMLNDMKDVNLKKLPIYLMQVTPVVKKALQSLGKNQIIIPGFLNNLMDVLGKFATPRWLLTNAFGFLVFRAIKK